MIHFKVFSLGICAARVTVNYVPGVPIPGLKTACLSRHTFSKSLSLDF